jgi:hypothetical protein
MRQNVPDVNFPPVVVDGRDQAGLVSPDIENGEFPEPDKKDQVLPRKSSRTRRISGIFSVAAFQTRATST